MPDAAIEPGLCPRKNPFKEDADEPGKLIIAIRATRIINAAGRTFLRRTFGSDVSLREVGIHDKRVEQPFSGGIVYMRLFLDCCCGTVGAGQ